MSGSSPLDAVPFARTLGIELASAGAEEVRGSLGWSEELCTAAGVMHGIRVRPFDIRAGNAAMYYPEANALVPTATDPDSKTPSFKAVPVTVEPLAIAREMADGRQALAVVQ